MEIRAIPGNILDQETDALVVNLFEDAERPEGATGAVDQAMDNAITDLMASGEIKGKPGELTLLHTYGRIAPKRVVVVGLGKQEKLTAQAVRRVSAEVARYLQRKRIARFTTIAHGAGAGGLDPKEAAQSMVEGSLLGLYQFTRHKKPDEDQRPLEEMVIVEQDESKLPALEEGTATRAGPGRGHFTVPGPGQRAQQLHDPYPTGRGSLGDRRGGRAGD